MYKWLILLSVLSAGVATGEPVWTWTDENGQVHYSDRPVPGARQIELRAAQAVPLAAPQTSTPTAEATTGVQPYRSLQVIRPAPQETLRNTGGALDVQLRLEPTLRPGHRLDVALDGERLNVNTSSTSFTISEVWRGEHSLQAVVLDAQGSELLRSARVPFVVLQVSVQNPFNPNAPGNPHAPSPRPSP